MKLRIQNSLCLYLLACVTIVSCARKSREKQKPLLFDEGDKGLENGGKVNEGVQEMVNMACLPARTDRLVYRYDNGSHIFIGFDIPEQGVVEYMAWEMKENNRELLFNRERHHYDVIHSDDIRPTLFPEHVLAATNHRAQREFRTKVNRVCQSTSITTVDCIIQAFAACARRFKTVKFDPQCAKKQSMQTAVS